MGTKEVKEWKCPECKKWSNSEDWGTDDSISCEDCGYHLCDVCPKCDGLIDTIYQKILKRKKKEQVKE